MTMLARVLLGASASIVLVLGVLHLLYTFRGPKLYPRDRALQQRMREVPLVISPTTSTWDAGVGFNASHAFSLLLFAGLYLDLAIGDPSTFARSPFLMGLGAAWLIGMAILAKRYWFAAPLAGVVVALVAYASAVVAVLA